MLHIRSVFFNVCATPQYPPGYLAAMANKTKKEACARPGRGGRGKHYPGRGRPRRRKIKKEEDDEEDEDELPMASMEEEEPQSNGEQKTSRESGGCFIQIRHGVVEERTGENGTSREA